MPMVPPRSPFRSILDFASQRESEANSVGDVITRLAAPLVNPQPTPAAAAGPLTAHPAVANDPLFSRMVSQESGWNPNAVSQKGATGLAQVMPSTAMDPGYGVPSIFDLAAQRGIPFSGRNEAEAKRLLLNEDLNLTMGKMYKDAMGQQFGGNEALTAAAYNAGPGAVNQYGGVPPYAETVNYVNSVTGQPRQGQLPGSVEGILASLYPQDQGAEKKTRKAEFFSGLGDMLVGLSRGQNVSVDNVLQARQERQRQAVADMRDRERARAAAALVYSQTGDADMAGAVASRAIDYSDVVSERERQRLEKEADSARVKQEQAAGRLAAMVEGMAPELGIPDKMVAEIVAGVKAGDDPTTFFSLQQQAKLADEARKAEAKTAEEADARAAAIEQFSASSDPVEKLAGSYMLLSPSMTLEDALKSAQERLKTTQTTTPDKIQIAERMVQDKQYPNVGAALQAMEVSSGNGAQGYEFQARIQSRMENLGESKEDATRAVLDEAKKSGVNNLEIGPDGTIRITTGAAAVGGGTGASGGVGEIAKPEPGTVTGTDAQGNLISAPIPGAIAPQIAETDLATKRQELKTLIDGAPTAAAKAKAEADLAALNVQQAQLDYDTASKTQGVDVSAKQVALQQAQATLAQTQAAAAKAAREEAAAAQDAKLTSSAEYNHAVGQFSIFERAAKSVMPDALKSENTGLLGTIGQGVAAIVPGSPQSSRSDFLTRVSQMGAQAMLNALKKAKEAGVTLTPVSNPDVEALGKSESLLAVPETLEGSTILSETAFQHNLAKDALIGPKDLTRYDEVGRPYKVGEDTLGVTADTFKRNWVNIPPDVQAAWRSGQIDTIPTDNPAYAEAANVINTMAKNYELYQGPLDRTVVGTIPPAPKDGDFSPEEWQATWDNMTGAEQEAYRKQHGGK